MTGINLLLISIQGVRVWIALVSVALDFIHDKDHFVKLLLFAQNHHLTSWTQCFRLHQILQCNVVVHLIFLRDNT